MPPSRLRERHRPLDVQGRACFLSRMMHVAFRAVAARPRLIAAACTAAVLIVVLPAHWRLATRLLVGWDAGVALYIGLALSLMLGADVARMRERAAAMDDGAMATLALTMIAALASIIAIAAELAQVRAAGDGLKLLHTLLAGGTLVLSWFFVHIVFAQHYAYEFYVENSRKEAAFLFPGKAREPSFGDFLYVALTIGASSAISDVDVGTSAVRRIVAAHSVLSFFFNSAVLGFAINVGAGLVGS